MTSTRSIDEIIRQCTAFRNWADMKQSMDDRKYVPTLNGIDGDADWTMDIYAIMRHCIENGYKVFHAGSIIDEVPEYAQDNGIDQEAVAKFRKLAGKVARLRNSKRIAYWEAHEDENCYGWGMSERAYPYRKDADQAQQRLDELEEQCHEIWHAANEPTTQAIEDCDKHFIVSC